MIKFVAMFLFINLAFADVKFVGQEYPPFNYYENGETKGEFVKVIKNICEKLSEKCSFEIHSLKRVMNELETGSADVGMTFIQAAERDVFADYIPLYKSKQVYWGKSDMAEFKSLNELSGKTAVSVQGSKSLDLVKEHAKLVKNVNVLESVSNDVALRMLSSDRFGEKGVALVNEIPGKFIIEKYGIKNLKIVYPVKTETYGLYLSKKSKNATFLKKFRDEILTLKKNKKLNHLFNNILIDLAYLSDNEYQI